jgi:predicted dehydrogenase/nucleoside-diphosphate-sugar epimerase
MSDTATSTKTPPSATRPIRTAIVGTGYIADFHARAIRTIEGVEVAGTCDANLERAQSFAKTWSIPLAFESLDSMLRDTKIDCIHILTPPDQHFSLAKAALQSGVHVLLEKPMCTSADEASELVAIARARNLYLGVSHNFLFSNAFRQLRELVHSNALGPIDQITINYLYELGQVRFGPFDSWMLRAPGNVILETGPHLISALLDLVKDPEAPSVTADRRVKLANGKDIYRRWRIRTTAGRTAIDLNINFGPGFPQRMIWIRSLFGSATIDFDADTCTIDQHTPLDIDLDRFQRNRRVARQIRAQSRQVFATYLLGKLKLVKRGSPYQNSIQDSTAAFYSAIKNGVPLDARISGETGRQVIEYCASIIAAAKLDGAPLPAPATIRSSTEIASKPNILVLGGGGFIGQELIRHLLASGHSVCAMVRGMGSLNGFQNSHLEVVRGDIRDRTALEAAMAGVEYVYHLAHAQCKTWQEYQSNDVEPTRMVGEVCLAAKVKRLIYTGTIDSYYAGANAGVITETTPLDPNIGRRNYYARAKAAAEDILVDMHTKRGLPLVILRPGIVIGRGGNPFHWGVGRFSENICEVWGGGTNKLPFVLVSDVASALVNAMDIPAIEGRSFNLIDTPLLTANEYIDELQRITGQNLQVHHRPIWKFYLADMAKWVVKLGVGHPDRVRIPSYFDWESRTQKAYFNCDGTRRDLNWTPASERKRMVDEGIGVALESWLEAIK